MITYSVHCISKNGSATSSGIFDRIGARVGFNRAIASGRSDWVGLFAFPEGRGCEVVDSWTRAGDWKDEDFHPDNKAPVDYFDGDDDTWDGSADNEYLYGPNGEGRLYS